jgi:transcriptional regulator GlxA family with amidase domain
VGKIVGGRLSRIQTWEQVAREARFDPGNMASLCGVSPRQMQRYFKEHFQKTPSHWLREFQCQTAKQLISQGYSSKATAFETGFSSESHFCREFRKIFGATPQSFSPPPRSLS